ncbi:hypothetical protein CHS0354_025233 [Potamilus streckersoni]|uniref:RING-type domain-containing protein n=1 Tax=Potamilus streckersoni TaxID=2493646 RepID=A0AAE0W6C4_9BIVA|nr:hypothetical protein CHS0354_025233 [Potamilus streckersoni]
MEEESQQIRDMTECPICLSSFQCPRLLPCGHSYCVGCLQSYIDGKRDENPCMTVLPCPTCRHPTHIPELANGSKGLATGFPVSHVIVKLMDIHRQSMIARSILPTSGSNATRVDSRNGRIVTDTQTPVNHPIEICSSSKSILRMLSDMKTPSVHLSDNLPSSQEHSTLPSIKKVTKVAEFIVRIYKDKSECFITCILDLPDSRYLFIDSNNRAVKIFEEDYTFQQILGLSVGPYCATLVSNTEAAVTLPDKKKIQFLRIQGQLRKTRKIKTRLKCWGITALGDQLAITTGVDEHSVLILDMKGREIRTIRLDNYRDLELLDPHMISTNRDKTILYVSYWRGNTLVSYFTSNNSALSYTGQKLRGPSGTDTDREGNICLCVFSSQCVQHISPNGTFIQELICTPNRNPVAVRFIRGTDKFMVGFSQCNQIDVYELL